MYNLPRVGAEAVLLGIAAFESSTRRMTSAITAIDRATTLMAKNSERSWNLTAAVTGAASLAVLANTRPIQRALEGASNMVIGFAATYEQKLSFIRAQTRATNAEMNDLTETSRKLSSQYGMSMNDIAEMVAELARGGVSIKQMLEGTLRDVLDIYTASGGELTLAKSAQAVAAGLVAFEKQGTSAKEVVDALTTAAMQSVATFTDLDYSFRQAVSVGGLLNYTVRDVAGAIGILGQSGLRGSEAGTMLRQMFTSLMDPTDENRKAMEKYEVSLYEATGKAVPFREVLRRLNEAFSDSARALKGMTEKERNQALAQIFTARAMRAAIVLSNEGTAALDEFNKQADEVSANNIATSMLKPLASQMRQTWATFQGFAIMLGGSLLPMLGRTAERFNEWLRTIDVAKIQRFGQAFVPVLVTIAGVVENVIIPAFRILLDSIAQVLSSNKEWVGFTRLLHPGLTDGIKLVSQWIAAALVYLSQLITSVNKTAEGAWIFKRVLEGIIAIPLILIAPAILAIGAAMLRASAWAIALSFGIGAVIKAIQWLSENWDSASKPIVTVIKVALGALTAYLTIVVAAWAYLAAMWTREMLALGVIYARLIFWTGAGYAVAAAQFVVNAAGVVAHLALIAYHAAVAGAAMAYQFVTAIGRAVIAIPALVSRLSLLAGQFIWLAGQILLTSSYMAIQFTASMVRAAIPAMIAASRAVAWYALTFTHLGLIMAAVAIRNTLFALASIPSLIKAIPAAVLALAGLARAYVVVAVQATIAAGRMVVAWIAAALPAVITAIGAMLTAISGLLVGLATIALVMGVVVIAWKNNWLDIQGFTGRVLKAVGDHIVEWLLWLRRLPVVGLFVDGTIMAFSLLRDTIPQILGDVGTSIGGFIEDIKKGFPDVLKAVGLVMPEFDYEAAMAEQEEQWKKWEQKFKAEHPELDQEYSPDYNPPEGEKVSKRSLIESAIRSGLQGVPRAGGKLVDYLTGLASDEESRIGPMIAALRALSPLIQQASNAKAQLLQTTIQIYEVDQAIEGIQRQMAALSIREQIALIDFEKQQLAIKTKMLELDIQMAPLRQRVADIDHQIEVLQRSNLVWQQQEVDLNIQMLPIKQAIAQIDERIALAQRTNLDLQLQLQQLELQALPIRQQIDAIERSIAEAKKDDLDLVRQATALTLKLVPLKQNIARLDRIIANVQRENYGLLRQQLALEISELPHKRKIEDIETRISRLQRDNLQMIRQRLSAELELLPYKRQMAELEERIAGITDAGGAIDQQKKELVAQHALDVLRRQKTQVEKDLDAAWTSMNVADILRLEASKEALDAQISSAEDNLDVIKSTGEEIHYKDELTRLGLEAEKIALDAVMKPIQKRLSALQDEQDEQKLLRDLAANTLEMEKRAQELLLDALEDKRIALGRLKDDEELRAKSIVLWLQAERQALQDLMKPIQDKIDEIGDLQELEDARQAAVVAALEVEKRKLQDLLKPIEDKITALNDLKALEEARQAVVVTQLQIEKRALEDLLKPLADRLQAVKDLQDADSLRVQKAVLALQGEKRAIEDLLYPLQRQKDEYQLQYDIIQNRADQIKLVYAEEEIELRKLLLAEQERKANLDLTLFAQQGVFDALGQKLVLALIGSKAFTADEAIEVAKRLGLWSSQNDKWADSIGLLDDTSLAADGTAAAVGKIPTNVAIKTSMDITPVTTAIGKIPTSVGTTFAVDTVALDTVLSKLTSDSGGVLGKDVEVEFKIQDGALKAALATITSDSGGVKDIDVNVGLVKDEGFTWATIIGWWNGIVEALSAGVQLVKDVASFAWSTVTGWWNGIGGTLDAGVQLVKDVASFAWSTVTGWWNGIGGTLNAGVQLVKDTTSFAWKTVTDWWDNLLAGEDKKLQAYGDLSEGTGWNWSKLTGWWNNLLAGENKKLQAYGDLAQGLGWNWDWVGFWWWDSVLERGKNQLQIAVDLVKGLNWDWSWLTDLWKTITGGQNLQLGVNLGGSTTAAPAPAPSPNPGSGELFWGVPVPSQAALSALIADNWQLWTDWRAAGGNGNAVDFWKHGRQLGVPGFHQGGLVPGMPGRNVLAMLQAGEYVVPASVVRAQSQSVSNYSNSRTYQYNVDAHYQQEQSPSSVRQDLSALIALTQR